MSLRRSLDLVNQTPAPTPIDPQGLFAWVPDGYTLDAHGAPPRTPGEVLWRRTNPAPYEMHPAARGHGKGRQLTCNRLN